MLCLGFPKIIEGDGSADRTRLRTMPPTRWNARPPADTTVVAAKVPLPLYITAHLRTRRPPTRDAASCTACAIETLPSALQRGNRSTNLPDVARGERPIAWRRARSDAPGRRPRRRRPSRRTRCTRRSVSAEQKVVAITSPTPSCRGRNRGRARPTGFGSHLPRGTWRSFLPLDGRGFRV